MHVHVAEDIAKMKMMQRGARGHYVSTVGLDQAKIRRYIKDQEMNDMVEDKYDSDLSDPF